MSKYTELQTEWFVDHEGVPSGVDSSEELIEQCDHKPEAEVTGVTGREFCPRCGKVLGETITQYKFD